MMDILAKIDGLRRMVSRYETESFVGFFAYFIKRRPDHITDIELNKFKSKWKDFFYLIALNVFAKEKGHETFDFNPTLVGAMADHLNEIKAFYFPQDLSAYTPETVIHEMAFRNHFDNGVLSYVEQDLEKTRSIFTPFDDKIKQAFGFDVNFIIEVYKISELVSNIKFTQQAAFTHTAEFKAFDVKRDREDFIFAESVAELPANIREAFYKFHAKPHDFLLFTRETLYAYLQKEMVDKFLDLFSCKAMSLDTFNYYSDINPLELAPILQLEENRYLHICQKQIPTAVYRVLYNFLQKDSIISDRFIQNRNKNLEKKVADIFKSFLPRKQAFFYQNYYVEPGYEQDLLVLFKGVALIVETKATRLREPLRDADKAVVRLKSDFKDAIQFGYEQCKRVEKLFSGEAHFAIKNEKGVALYTVNPAKIQWVFSIVVTLERFGNLQTDLDLLLQKQTDDQFPWSVYIDDLETFLLTLKHHTNNHTGKLFDFLRLRRLLHGHLHAIDELDVCGRFITNENQFRHDARESDKLVSFSPHEQVIFDQLYFQKLLRFKEEPLPDFHRYSGRKK